MFSSPIEELLWMNCGKHCLLPVRMRISFWGNNRENVHIKLCFVVLKAWVEKQYKLSNLVSLSAGLGQRRSINKQNGGLVYLVFGCPLTSFALRKLGLFEFIFLNN